MRYNVGCLTAVVNDPVQGVPIPMRLLYPTRETERAVGFGPYEMAVAMNAPLEGEHLPFVVFSHGGSGSSLTYRDLAAYLARAGFVVALPEHPGNNRADNSLEGTAANLENRPRHVRLAIDAAFAHEAVGHLLLRDKIALIGHSMGGYTVLAVAGCRPMASPHETVNGQIEPVSVWPGCRISALILLAPECAWFWSDGALGDIDVPILLLTAEKHELAHQLHADRVKLGVRNPGKVDHRVVPNAGHHAFQSPFPPSMTRPDFPPSQDPEGFDRATFQPILCAESLSFLRGNL
jgi:predicted dienelactone hydrolase